jgi:hypothetical protein
MKKSDSIAALAAALSKAQAEIKGALKDTTNPFFKSEYANLQSVWESCREALTKNGLSVVQVPLSTEQGPALETILMHSSGEWIGDVIQINPVKNDPQGVGSAITYYRRYALAAIVGVYQSDDDGEGAMGRDTIPEPKITKVTEVKRAQQKVVVAGTPICCGVPMLVSRYDSNVLYCGSCKSKQSREVVSGVTAAVVK